MMAVTAWLELAGINQDLIWFVVLVGWSFAGLIWWRAPQRRTHWSWLPWAAGAGVLTALLQFLVFNPPLDLFYERLVPGTNNTYTPARIDPDLFADIALACVYAALAALWWRSSQRDRGSRIRGGSMAVLALGLAVAHAHHPRFSGTLLALLPLAALFYLWKHTRARTALVLTAMIPLVSPIGPLAALAGKLQRDGPTRWFGAACALFHLLALGFVMAGLAREVFRSKSDDERRAFWRDIRPFLIGGALWLVAGTIFALNSGRAEVREVKTNRLRQTAARVPGLSPELRDAIQRSPDGRLTASQTFLLEAALEEDLNATPFAQAARLLVKRDDSLITIATVTIKGENLGRQHRPWDAADDDAWNRAEPLIDTAALPVDGAPYYCRAPITDATGAMVGWLEFEWVEFYWTMERKWRTSPLLITALGAILAGVFFVQRRGSREREEALRAAAIADEAARVKTSFLAKVSHELRTPLQSILGYGELLQTAVPEGPAQKQLAALRHHGQLMTRLVNDLIDLSALESGAFRLIPKPVNLVELVTQTVDSLRPSADGKGLALRLDIDPELPTWITADAERLREILINLIANAVKFTDAGSVDVSLRLIRRSSDDAWEIRVIDTGPGIAATDQATVFQPFTRLEPTAHREGTGLGLALVAGLCRSMNGAITLESAPGKGSCFRVRLPLQICAKPVSTPATAPDPLIAGQRVLVADDNALIRELFVNYLQALGAECLLAADGEEALHLAQTGGCETMILDLAMPKLTGCEVARRLRAAGSRMRIIGVSAHTNAADREEALAAGMDTFLTKPVELAALGRTVAGRSVATNIDERMHSLRQGLRAQFNLAAPAQTQALRDAYDRRDWETMKTLVHRLRNSAIAIDDSSLQEACAQLESALRTTNREAIAKNWTACTAALQVWLHSEPEAAV